MLEWSHGYPSIRSGTVAQIFPYILVDRCFYPAEGTEPTEHTGHKCGRSHTFPPATARSGALVRPFPTTSSALPFTQTLLGLPILLPALGRVACLVQTPVSALFLSFRPYLAARPGAVCRQGVGAGRGRGGCCCPPRAGSDNCAADPLLGLKREE